MPVQEMCWFNLARQSSQPFPKTKFPDSFFINFQISGRSLSPHFQFEAFSSCFDMSQNITDWLFSLFLTHFTFETLLWDSLTFLWQKKEHSISSFYLISWKVFDPKKFPDSSQIWGISLRFPDFCLTGRGGIQFPVLPWFPGWLGTLSEYYINSIRLGANATILT